MTSSLPRILVIYGTRPEAIKLAPVVPAAAAYDDWRVDLCSTGQHRELLAPVVETLGLAPNRELAVMAPGQGLNLLTARLLQGLDQVIDELRPDWVVVQGDTTSAMAGALAAFHRGVRVAHVEAGLRTGDLRAPFPEEANRQLVARVAGLHFAPTPGALQALLAEGVTRAAIEVTGNTVVDAVTWMVARLPAGGAPPRESATVGDPPDLQRFFNNEPSRRLVLITGHRRESFDGGLVAVCEGIAALASAHPEVDFVYPVHLNPKVRAATDAAFGGLDNVHCLPPVGYASAVWLLRRAHFVVTDSGGLQEEAPVLGTPVIVTRRSTERPEGVARGCAVVVGYERARLVEVADRWLRDPAAYAAAVPRSSPYGDGLAGRRIVAALRARVGLVGDAIGAWP
jgi:UDP-N-acetylglucosamine 2-epimerase